MNQKAAISIRRLRALIFIAMVAAVSLFAVIMLRSVDGLSDRFGPQVRADLEWRATRGAHELAKSAELGLAVSDRAMVEEAFGSHTHSVDVLALVAVDAKGHVVARHGEPVPGWVFGLPAGAIISGEDYVGSWRRVEIEGAEVGRVAILVSTSRVAETEDLLNQVSRTTVIAALLVIAFGTIVIIFVTRAVAIRDARLRDYAANLERMVDIRTRELDERNHGMRRVFDHVAQGLVTIDLHGKLDAERSAVVERWLGTSEPGATLSDLLRPHSDEFVMWLELGLDSIREDVLPVEVCLFQMPRRFAIGGRSFDVTYSPIANGGRIERLLVIITDATEQVAREHAESEQRELLALFQRILADRQSCEEFLTEASDLVHVIESSDDRIAQARAIHTLKGNCGMFGLERYSHLCHAIENELSDMPDCGLEASQRTRLIDAWREVTRTMARLLGEHPREIVEVAPEELARVLHMARAGSSSRDLANVLASWSHEPVARRFDRLGQHAIALGHRLERGAIEVEIIPNAVRIDAARFAPLWNAMVHVVRNAVDHGFEGAPAPHILAFRASQTKDELVIALADNGRGIDWESIRERARKLDMPCTTHADLVEALFGDGITTRDSATTTSGRGVGLSALRATVLSIGGSIDVESAPNAGTTFWFKFPRQVARSRSVSAAQREWA